MPRLLRKYRRKDQDVTKTSTGNFPYQETRNDTIQKGTKDTANAQTKDMLVLGEITRGAKKFEDIEKNTGLDKHELETLLEDLEKRGLMRVERKQGIFGSKVELYATDEGFKKYHS